MYLSSLLGTLKALTGRYSVKKRLTSRDHHHIEHFGRPILEFQESIKHQPGQTPRTLLGHVPKARHHRAALHMVCGIIPMKRELK